MFVIDATSFPLTVLTDKTAVCCVIVLVTTNVAVFEVLPESVKTS